MKRKASDEINAASGPSKRVFRQDSSSKATYLDSGFRLTFVRGLPDVYNVDCITLSDILNRPISHMLQLNVYILIFCLKSNLAIRSIQIRIAECL